VPTGECSQWSIHYIHWHRPFLCEWAKCQPGNTQNEMVEPYLRSRIWWHILNTSFLVNICLFRLVSKIFAYDRQTDKGTDNADDYYNWPPHCGRPANLREFLWAEFNELLTKCFVWSWFVSLCVEARNMSEIFIIWDGNLSMKTWCCFRIGRRITQEMYRHCHIRCLIRRFLFLKTFWQYWVWSKSFLLKYKIVLQH